MVKIGEQALFQQGDTDMRCLTLINMESSLNSSLFSANSTLAQLHNFSSVAKLDREKSVLFFYRRC